MHSCHKNGQHMMRTSVNSLVRCGTDIVTVDSLRLDEGRLQIMAEESLIITDECIYPIFGVSANKVKPSQN